MGIFWSHIAPIAYLFMAITQFAIFIRLVYKSYRNYEINKAFVNDMATNHLPHIYDMLLILSEAQGLKPKLPPPIRWMKLNGDSDKDKPSH